MFVPVPVTKGPLKLLPAEGKLLVVSTRRREFVESASSKLKTAPALGSLIKTRSSSATSIFHGLCSSPAQFQPPVLPIPSSAGLLSAFNFSIPTLSQALELASATALAWKTL